MLCEELSYLMGALGLVVVILAILDTYHKMRK